MGNVGAVGRGPVKTPTNENLTKMKMFSRDKEFDMKSETRIAQHRKALRWRPLLEFILSVWCMTSKLGFLIRASLTEA